MSKYIDADLLRNEIERILGELSPDFYEYNYDAAKTELLNLLLSFIDSLQQKQQEKPVPNDLEEEIKRYGEKNMFNIPAFQQVARHFAKWGAENLKK